MTQSPTDEVEAVWRLATSLSGKRERLGQVAESLVNEGGCGGRHLRQYGRPGKDKAARSGAQNPRGARPGCVGGPWTWRTRRPACDAIRNGLPACWDRWRVALHYPAILNEVRGAALAARGVTAAATRPELGIGSVGFGGTRLRPSTPPSCAGWSSSLY